MRICHVAHGIGLIPPYGWGSTEARAYDFKYWCEQAGHTFHIVNRRHREAIVAEVNDFRPDVVHLHCELHFSVAPRLAAGVTILESRWPSFFEGTQLEKTRAALGDDAFIACATPSVRQRYLEMGIAAERLFLAPVGARSDLIRFEREAYFPNRTLCLAAVNERKRQHLLKDIPFVDFAGPIRPLKQPAFERHPNYLGEWRKAKVYAELTDYANLALLSAAEVAPLAPCEALMAGLGVVLSEAALGNLDPTLPFVAVIPEERVSDRDYVETLLRRNQTLVADMRSEIRRYAVENLELETGVRAYLETLRRLCGAVSASGGTN